MLGAAALFVVFLDHSQRLHGDALSGTQIDGRYFVADHGRRTEVAEDDWRTNRTLGVGMIATFPLGMAGMAYLLFAQVFRRAIYRRSDDEVAAGVRRVRASGAVVAEVRTGGNLGWVGFGGKLLRVAVHTGGVVVKPIFLPEFGIAREQVRAVRPRKVWKLVEQVEIDHGAPDVPSPIVLALRHADPVVAALEALVRRA
jgi:hypothetical protein